MHNILRKNFHYLKLNSTKSRSEQPETRNNSFVDTIFDQGNLLVLKITPFSFIVADLDKFLHLENLG